MNYLCLQPAVFPTLCLSFSSSFSLNPNFVVGGFIWGNFSAPLPRSACWLAPGGVMQASRRTERKKYSGLTYLSIVLCSACISLVRFEQSKKYYEICRLSGIGIKKIILKLLKKEFLMFLAPVTAGAFCILYFASKIIFTYSVIEMLLCFLFALLLNFILHIILTIYQLKRWVSYDP